MMIHYDLEPYNPIWNTPSQNSGESMPCGGHDIGLNVWVVQRRYVGGQLTDLQVTPSARAVDVIVCDPTHL